MFERGLTVSIIIPARRAAAQLAGQLEAVGHQIEAMGGAIEVLVSIQGPLDATVAVVRASRVPDARIVHARFDRGAAAARNAALAHAHGDIVLFMDADDLACDGLVSRLVAAAQRHGASAGVLRYPEVELDLRNGELFEPFCFRPFAITACFAVRRDLVGLAGGFNESLHCGEDVDLSWRLAEYGYSPVHVPNAVLLKQNRNTCFSAFGQSVRYGWSDVRLYALWHDRGLRRRPFSRWLEQFKTAVGLRPVAGPQQRATAAGVLVGRALASVRFRRAFL
jgi:GT2 family glycosyltransferase